MGRKSRKSRKTSMASQRQRSETPQNVQSTSGSTQSTASSVMSSTRSTLSSAASTANSHRVLIGSVLAGCGAGIALFATESGKRLRGSVGERIGSLSSQVTEQASNVWGQVRDVSQRMLSGEDMVEDTELERERSQSRTRRAA
jgi:hypothetical protein